MKLLLAAFVALLVANSCWGKNQPEVSLPGPKILQVDQIRNIDCEDIDDCQDPPGGGGQGERVCGSNGKTFATRCEFLRAHCKEKNVEFKNFGECSASDRCLGQRRAAKKRAKNQKGVFIPTCNPDGTFKVIQCHHDTGYCWCSTEVGNVVSGTVTVDATPDCQNVTGMPPKSAHTHISPILHEGDCEGKRRKLFNRNMLKNMIQGYKRENRGADNLSDKELRTAALNWKFNELNTRKDRRLKRAEYKGLQKIVSKKIRPKKCAKKFPKICDFDGDKSITLEEWIKCFTSKVTKGRNNDRKKGRKKKKKLGEGRAFKPRPCEYERRQALDTGNPEAYIPKCTDQGFFRPVQCYGSNVTDSWYCFCVNVQTGDMIDNTSMKDGTPNCDFRWPKCPPSEKEKIFLKALIEYLMKFAKDKIYKKRDMKIIVNEENVIEIFFKFIDKNGNNIIEKKERRALRKAISKEDRSVWVCGKKINDACDNNGDRKITLAEFTSCLSPRKVYPSNNESYAKLTPRKNLRKYGQNPFEHLIKAETKRF